MAGKYLVYSKEHEVIKRGQVDYKRSNTFFTNCVLAQSNKKGLEDIHEYYKQGCLIVYHHTEEDGTLTTISKQLQVVNAIDWLGVSHRSEVFSYNAKQMFGYIQSLPHQEITIHYAPTIKEMRLYDEFLRYCLETLDTENKWSFGRSYPSSLTLIRR